MRPSGISLPVFLIYLPDLRTWVTVAFWTSLSWASLWGSSATTPLVNFHHRLTACPSYHESRAIVATTGLSRGKRTVKDHETTRHTFSFLFSDYTPAFPLKSIQSNILCKAISQYLSSCFPGPCSKTIGTSN